MADRHLKGLRLKVETISKIDALARATGELPATVVDTAVDELYERFTKAHGAIPDAKPLAGGRRAK